MKSVVVVRHGERQDYVMRDSGKNWIPTSDRPWDPPLTSRGHEQSKALGYALPKILKDQNLPPIAAIYSSPFLRCRQTSVGLIVGSQTAEKEEEDSELGKNLKVQVELGLTESLNENWYRSWAVPGTDGTWGYQKQEKPLTELDRSTLHPAAKDSVKNVLDWKLATSDDDDNIREYMDFHHVSKSTIDTLYCMDPPKFESFKMQRGRMFNTMELLSDENNDKTIVMVSHGGPVTHLFESLTGEKWTVHGVSKYCSYSIYQKKDGDDSSWIPIVVNRILDEEDRISEETMTTTITGTDSNTTTTTTFTWA